MSDPLPPKSANDFLTPLAVSILQAGGPNAYAKLVVNGAGTAEGKRLLAGIEPSQLLAIPIVNRDAAAAMLSGLWLWHDWLDESHHLSQAISSSAGSFWHAIMHRREGDFSNAKYWYGRCRTHPAIREIAANGTPANARGEWDPMSFVDKVEGVYLRLENPSYAAAVEIQRLEWNALFAACARSAAGNRSE